MNEYSRQKDTEYQAYCILPINAPLRKYFHVDWAINTLKVFGFDEVIAVEEELSEIYRHRTNGLEPVTTEGELKLEKDAVYRSNGALQLVDNRSQKVRGKLEKKIGHILMLREESIRVVDTFDHWLVSALMNRGLSREYEIKEHLS